MPDVSDYDKLDYDYSTYWEKREYENSAEKHILNKIFNPKHGNWFLDIGGSYGRLTSTYYNSYNKPIILDYSLKTLQRNKELIKSKYPNVELIAANAYKMPFKDNSFDGGLMVRVLHHIEKPKTYIKEVSRILNNNSTYVQEYANKVHIKAAIKSVLKLNFDIFSEEPYQQPKRGSNEGTTESEKNIFLNYHPSHIKKLLENENFSIVKKYGCSFLRSPFIKKLLNENIMMFFEIIMQDMLSWSNISPSIFLECKLSKSEAENIEYADLKDVLHCPDCKGDLNIDQEKAICKSCSKEFFKKEGIWDFRVK